MSLTFNQLKSLHYRSFAKVAILPYIGGTLAHILRLFYQFPLGEAPHWIHWAIVLIGGYAWSGFVLYSGIVQFKGIWDKILYCLVIFHLGGSVVLHGYSLTTHSNQWMTVFSLQYSYFAVLYFIVLGIYCYQLSRRAQFQHN